MKKYILFIFVTQMMVACIGWEKDYLGYDIELWKDTDVWDFAKCISKGEFERAEKILRDHSIDIDFKDPKFGETLLYWAVFNDNIDAVKFLVEHGANPNAHNTCNGTSPMVLASSRFNSIEILKYLLEHGGNPNDYVKENEVLSYARILDTPLTKAAFFSLEKTKMLIKAGGNLNFSVKPGRTAFFNAAISTRIEILDYLLFNCKLDYKKTFTITIKGDTLYLKEIMKNNPILHPKDSIVFKRINDYLDARY